MLPGQLKKCGLIFDINEAFKVCISKEVLRCSGGYVAENINVVEVSQIV